MFIRICLSLLLLYATCICTAQTADRKTAVGLYGGSIQYQGEFGDQFFNTSQLQGAVSLSVSQYLTSSFNLGLMYTAGDVKYDNGRDFLDGVISNMNLFIHYKFFNGKILGERSFFAPYLIAGFGATEWKETRPRKTRFTDAFIPVGAGFRFRVSNSLAVMIQSSYHFTMNDHYDNAGSTREKDYFLHSQIGLAFSFGEGKDSDGDRVKDGRDLCPGTPGGVAVDLTGCPLDGDGDAVPDYLDLCPDLFGIATAKGCPDIDRDSIADQQDRCPEIAGPTETAGCPDRDQDEILDSADLCPDEKGPAVMNGCPDSDQDLIADKDDECPGEKGIASLHGCPDRDGDGIADREDSCPDSAGIAANKGCPEIREEVKKVFEQALTGLKFETGSDVIKRTSYRVMDEVVRVMNEHPAYKLVISGHTDNTGSSEKNMELSERRAAAAKNFLVARGIDPERIASKGFGDSLPVAGNTTREGRATNRRVEFKVVF